MTWTPSSRVERDRVRQPRTGAEAVILGARLRFWAALAFIVGYQVVPVFVVYWPVVGWRLR